MMIQYRAILPAALLAAGLVASGGSVALANDSAAELSIGGLQFSRSPDIEMRSEDLKISLDRVTVRYEFFNTSAAPVTLTVAFPLPDIDLAEGEAISFPSSDPLNFVEFATQIDGAAIKFNSDQRAFIGDKDVTAPLRELKVPVLPLGANQFRPQDLPAETRTKMANDGLLVPAGSDERGRPLYAPGWVVKTSVYREQTFPPKTPVIVSHTYRPSIGAGADTILRKPLRKDRALASEIERYRRDYCVSEGFLQQLDRSTGTAKGDGGSVQERRVSYILKTGANWAGPIKSFHLSIDNGGHLVSYCPGKLSTAGKQPLDVTAKDFLPDRDIKLLYVGRF